MRTLDLVIDALGAKTFHKEMLAYLDGLVGADHFSLLRFGSDQDVNLVCTASRPHWRFAGAAQQAYLEHFHQLDPNRGVFRCRSVAQYPVVSRLQRDQVPDSDYRHYCYDAAGLVDRISVLISQGKIWYALNLYRSRHRGNFTNSDAEAINVSASVLASLAKKHDCLSASLSNDAGPASRIGIFSARMVQREPSLSQRELAVISRILTGMTAENIALDLGIGVQSVHTYCKRAYIKLGVTNKSQLFNRAFFDAPA